MKLRKSLSRLLCNSLTGTIIVTIFRNRIPSVRHPSFRFATLRAGVSKVTASSIFWGFYEGAEIRFVEKYFKGDVDAIELGSSVGVLSSHIITKFQKKDRRFIGVEANANLKEVWKINTARHNERNVSLELLNAGIHYHSDTIHLSVTDNTTESKVNSSTGVKIPACTLADVVRKSAISEYALFCDIEGTEVEIFLNEDEVFNQCRYLFIELHDTVFDSVTYQVKDILNLITKKGFEVIDHYGPVYYFRNSQYNETPEHDSLRQTNLFVKKDLTSIFV